MSLEKISTLSLSADAAVRWVAGPGRKPKLTQQELTALSEEGREKILNLIQKRQSLPHGPNRRRDQLRIGNAIALLRHPGRVSKSVAAKRAKSKWITDNRKERLRSALAYYYRNRKPHPIEVLSDSRVARYARIKRKVDPQFAIVSRLRATMSRALRRQFTRKSARTFELIGCSPVELRAHIESLFLPGMSWENRLLWHVDHKKPLASFDLRDPVQQRLAFHFTNLQPLWARDNQRKGART